MQNPKLPYFKPFDFFDYTGSNVIDSDFQLLAATNQDLEVLIKAGRFREDLYFRLAFFEIDVTKRSRFR